MRLNTILLTLGMALAAGTGFAESKAQIDGAEAGKWTMDLDAAKKTAAEKKLPILLNFTGSDWCGYCQQMESNVFVKAEWQEYAKDNLMLVMIDFPRMDKSLVPEKYVARNEELATKFGVQGFPTFVVLDSDGESVLGQLSSSDSVDAFTSELKTTLRNSAAEREKYIASLKPEAQAQFKELNGKLEAKRDELEKAQELMISTQERMGTLSEEIGQLEEDVRAFRIAQLDEESQKKYAEIKAQFDTKLDELKKWIGTEPEPTEENMKKFQDAQAELQKLDAEMNAF